MGGRTIVSDEEEVIEEEDDEREVRDAEVADIDERNEEDEEGQDEYEKDDFIVDDVEEEEEHKVEEEIDSDEEEKHKKKKRRKRESEKNYVLDEDDYELLEDNNITGFHRPKVESKKFKRLKKASRDTEQEEWTAYFDEEEIGGNGRSGRTAEEKLKHSLFGDDDGAPLEDIAEEDPSEEEDGDIGVEDDLADFIVDEEDVDENGAPVRRKKISKKKSRRAPGIASAALQEAHDLFGDVDELLRVRKEGLARRDDMHGALEDEFEPFILQEKFMTKKDNRIRETDVPERIQLMEEVTGPFPSDEKSIEDESAWVYNQLMSTDTSPFYGHMELLGGINKEDIRNVLALHHVQKLDIPFIATYRKEMCLSLLKEAEQDVMDNEDNKPARPKIKWRRKLWAIHNLDKKWLLLQKQKRALRSYYNKRFMEEAQRIDHETRLNLNQELSKSILNALDNAETEREANDVDMKFNLHFPPGEVSMEEGQYKRPLRKSKYTNFKNAGLWEVVSKFGFSSEQFGALLTLEKMRQDELEDAKETPEEVVMNFTCNAIPTSQEVLKHSRYMAAAEISCEPCVRKHVRSIFMEKAVVSTCPTFEGKTAIDSFHQFAGIKWLCNKPLSEFRDSQWLLIEKAEEEKLLQVLIKLPEDMENKILNDFNENYLSDGVSKSAQLWNEQRKLILKESLFDFLLPSMAKEARILLATRAKSVLLLEYGGQLWSKASVSPYHLKDNEFGMDENIVPRVMACCWGPGQPATTFVMLDSSGEVLDLLYAGSINTRSKRIEDQQRKEHDQQRLIKFMTVHQPQVVVLGAVNLSCKILKDELFEIIFAIVENHPREVDQDIDTVKVVYGDESLPHLYENSRISSDQLPTQQGIVKRAVALGRYLQNPLAMIATLCGPAREILSWKLNPLENLLSSDEKYEIIEQVLVDVTNQVGLDINLASSHEWLFAPLQFISGLGPRKASGLQRALVRVGSVFSRKELMTEFMKKKVFFNAVGFLRIRRSGVAASSIRIIDLLDDTRIHPESYKLAKNMAKDVYDEDVQDYQNDSDDEVQEMAIEHVREQPKLLRVLDIDEYAKSVEERLGERKKETLYDIKMELLHGFEDWRTPYSEPTQDEEFYMISGETEVSLAVGRVVQATVKQVTQEKLTCALDSGLTGFLMKKVGFQQRRRDYQQDDLDFQQDDLDFTTENFPVGTIINCKVEKIQKNRYLVFLALGDGRDESVPKLDPYYHEGESNKLTEEHKTLKEKELVKKHFRPRMIVHPSFQNLTADEAIEFISEKEPGESIIRPSPRGPSYLTLTLKVYDGVYAHKDIAEGAKDYKDVASLLHIGKTLKIGEDTFEDLDEVMDRYVDPLVTHLKAMLRHRKFKHGTKAEVDELLRAEKAEYPARIVYCFGICHEHPGTFILSYIRNTQPHHIYITLYPKGFRFRSNFFDNIDRLVAHFQKHIDDLPREAVQPNRSVAAMVPMKSAASGGFSALSGGWGGSSPNSDGGWKGGPMNSQRERDSTPGSRTGRNDYRNSVSRGGHPSGTPYGGRGQAREAGSVHGGASKWASVLKEGGDGRSAYSSSTVRNSPGGEALSSGWGSTGSGIAGWGGGGARNGGSGNHENSSAEGGNAGGHHNSGSWGSWGSSGATHEGRNNRNWGNPSGGSGQGWDSGNGNEAWGSSGVGGSGGSAAPTGNSRWGGSGGWNSGSGSRGWS